MYGVCGFLTQEERYQAIYDQCNCLTEEELNEKEELQAQGFGSWNKKYAMHSLHTDCCMI